MSSDVHLLSYNNDVVGLRAAMTNGANPNEAHPKAGTLPLQLACQGNAIDAIRELIRGGANADAVFTFASRVSDKVVTGRSALMYAESAEAATLLLAAGADVNRIDSDGWSALVHAAHSANLPLVSVLLQAGADTSVSPWYHGKHRRLTDFLQCQCRFLEDKADDLKQPAASERLAALRAVATAIDTHLTS